MALKRLNTEHLTAIKWLSLPNKGGKTNDEIAGKARLEVDFYIHIQAELKTLIKHFDEQITKK
ncbi:hypothetical protein BCY92_03670 [Bacillus wiedmannii]|uniref:hypothetical protein n=1 Tax=Bacillus wiedmannii TaxID=1890302 RepID=UPI000E74655A|nr:hypothetical protein BCY92_03670 [Bacillus wiedmannii]